MQATFDANSGTVLTHPTPLQADAAPANHAPHLTDLDAKMLDDQVPLPAAKAFGGLLVKHDPRPDDKPTLKLADKPTLELADKPALELADKPTLELADKPTLELAGNNVPPEFLPLFVCHFNEAFTRPPRVLITEQRHPRRPPRVLISYLIYYRNHPLHAGST